jgi:predicted nucleic acid-binding protein
VVSSDQVRTEVERNLAAKVPAALTAFQALAEAACTWVGQPPPRRVAALRSQADPKDRPTLAAAIEERCEWLVTFNIRHFRPKGEGIRVATPGEFVEALRALLEALANE